MAHELEGGKVALLVDEGFEQVEMTEPRRVLEDAGAGTDLLAPHPGKVRGMHAGAPGEEFDVDVPLPEALPEDYDALVLPGGGGSVGRLRSDPEVQRFVQAFFAAGKPVAAIGYGPAVLIDAGVAGGRRLTSDPAIAGEFARAGAQWVDAEVVGDGGLVTSRASGDLPAFERRAVESFGERLREAPEVDPTPRGETGEVLSAVRRGAVESRAPERRPDAPFGSPPGSPGRADPEARRAAEPPPPAGERRADERGPGNVPNLGRVGESAR